MLRATIKFTQWDLALFVGCLRIYIMSKMSGKLRDRRKVERNSGWNGVNCTLRTKCMGHCREPCEMVPKLNHTNRVDTGIKERFIHANGTPNNVTNRVCDVCDEIVDRVRKISRKTFWIGCSITRYFMQLKCHIPRLLLNTRGEQVLKEVQSVLCANRKTVPIKCINAKRTCPIKCWENRRKCSNTSLRGKHTDTIMLQSRQGPFRFRSHSSDSFPCPPLDACYNSSCARAGHIA